MTDFPEIINIELTNRCNKLCKMCIRYWHKLNKYRNDLNLDLLKKILDQTEGENVYLNLGGIGESLLVEELSNILLTIKQFNPEIKTGINTNGINLTKDKWEWLTDGRLDYFTISIDATDKENYKWLTGDELYDLVCYNSTEFLKYKNVGNKPFTTVHCFDIPKFRDHFNEFNTYWQKYADNVQIRSLGNWAGTVPMEDFGVKLCTDGICENLWNSIVIDTNGGYHKCCASLQLTDANSSIFDLSIRDYWNSEKMNEMRNAMTSGSFLKNDFCCNCSKKSLKPNILIEKKYHSEVTILPL